MSAALERGENVKISSFGTFVLRAKTQRMGRNPKTGDEVPIEPRRVLTFRARQTTRDRVASAGEGGRQNTQLRSEESRVGTEGDSTCRSRGVPEHKKKKK